MNSPYAVELREVTKRFGTLAAVDNISLQIQDGEFFSLLGPSGCGKTTTLRLIAGFELPTKGEVLIGGESQGYLPAYKRPVNTVFQHYALFPHMTVYKNVAFGLDMQGVSKGDIRQRVFAGPRNGASRRDGTAAAKGALRRTKAAGGPCPRIGQSS